MSRWRRQQKRRAQKRRAQQQRALDRLAAHFAQWVVADINRGSGFAALVRALTGSVPAP